MNCSLRQQTLQEIVALKNVAILTHKLRQLLLQIFFCFDLSLSLVYCVRILLSLTLISHQLQKKKQANIGTITFSFPQGINFKMDPEVLWLALLIPGPSPSLKGTIFSVCVYCCECLRGSSSAQHFRVRLLKLILHRHRSIYMQLYI